MRVNFIFFSCLLAFCSSFSQKAVPGFGVIDKSDLLLKSCSFEPDAFAMKLFDVQEAEYEPSPFTPKIRTERRVRIKIFNEKGYPHATVKIPYYSNKKNTIVSDLKGIVYTLDNSGSIITHRIEEADFFKEKAVAKVGVLSFTFPNLQSGCVIEYSYTLTEKNTTNFNTWILQSDIPVAYISNSLIIPTYSGFKEYISDASPVSKKTELIKKGLDKNKTTFSKENIPSFKAEPYMSSARDNILRMAYVLFEDGTLILDNYSAQSLWKIVANRILKTTFFDDLFKKIIPGTEKIIDTALNMLNSDDRIRYLYRVVKRRIPESQGQASFADDITDSWKSRNANTAEINLTLINLLKRAGINCSPVLVSTRENGKINLDFPSFGQFNGLDILVNDNGLTYLIDASLRFQPYNIPPVNILNRHVLVMDPDNIRWVFVNDSRPLLKQTTNIFGTFTKDGKIEAGATITYSDYSKSLFLDSANSNIETSDSRFIDKKITGLKILTDNREIGGDGEPLVQTIEFDYEAQQSGEFYFIAPRFFTLKKTNPFLHEKRTTDIDFGCNQEASLSMTLQIPETLQVETLPQSITVRSPDSSLVFTRITYSNKSTISFSHSLEIRKPVFEKTEYAALYEFFKRTFALMAEEIILKKK